MTPDQLRALADALEPMAQAPRFEGFDVPAFCAWVRACADAEPVAWMHDGFMSTDYERVQHDEMRNRSCGFKAKPIIPLYAHPVPAAPQAEPKRDPLTQAAHDVLAERRRQIDAEGWTPEHDDEHSDGSMAAAAACYAMHSAIDAGIDSGQIDRYTVLHSDRYVPRHWPWDREWWKPRDLRRNLVKAGALILAEIERLDRIGGSND